MTYSQKVKASNIIINAIEGLKDGEKLRVSYGTDSDNMPIRYFIACNVYGSGASYSIHRDEIWSINGMNISTIGNTVMEAYSYDMMGQRTTYRFPLYEMEIVEVMEAENF